MIYDLLAPFYDEVNREIDYRVWADFIEKIINREYNLGKPELILDLGCGTGKMTVELAKRGYDMTGVDISLEMLDVARNYSESEGVSENILWLCQDMTEFELYGTVDVTVSCLDCINHLCDVASLDKCLNLVHNYLVPDGLFIFDVNGKWKFENVYASNSYVTEVDSDFCIWQNYYNPKSKICDFYITLFEMGNDGKYTRYDDVEKERMYTLRMLKKHLSDCGFQLLGAYKNFDFEDATDLDERIYLVAKCIKE